MAKALLGYRVHVDDRLLLESARLRSRVRDLETVIEDLQHDNDRLRDNDRQRGLRGELPAEVEAAGQPVH